MRNTTGHATHKILDAGEFLPQGCKARGGCGFSIFERVFERTLNYVGNGKAGCA